MEKQKNISKNAEWIKKCEEKFYDNFFDIACDICQERHLRIIRLFGPSCSGKTTAADILIKLFHGFGKKAHVISIDDFFYDREELSRRSRERGLSGIDYDSPDTIDCEALRVFAREIFESSEVHCPTYDFKEGRRGEYKSMKIDENDIFIFEGIQANYPEVVSMLSEHGSASIYIVAKSPLIVDGKIFEPNEIRLMRRIVRDYHFRASKPEFTFMLWESVRANEEKNIFPYIDSDYSVDSTMEYEIGVLKPYLEDILSKIDENDKHYSDAQRILRKIEGIEAIPSELILDGMLYCEFV